MKLRRITAEGEEQTLHCPTKDMPRLQTMFASMTEEAVAHLQFYREGAVVCADGQAEVSGEVVCSRCLHTVPFVLRARIHTGFAESETLVERVDSKREAVVVEHDRLDAAPWLEDEFLLSFPLTTACTEWQGGVCPLSGVDPEHCEFPSGSEQYYQVKCGENNGGTSE